ncbi:LysR substrate-binding domain-containing protein [Glaciimonas sp. PCH181]|uniref:LysR substrate-binding domain-containing protein n=1 Tax=Glaciimonas sp. PCH181 TaxID=2133943 RepID=UPI000D3D95B4|nr:LysR substrate-binding domain-containing protein [Glaciimonas sp. PCH181]PUA19517.1 LysR family transcriptional regulator [Glaciimonas sp. PCH181]
MLELRQLRYFVTLAEELNFGRAATRLHITQPPLSLQIMHLEDQLGAKLFIRGKRPLQLTYAGKELLIKSRRLLADAEGLSGYMHLLTQGDRGRLVVGFIIGSLPILLPAFINSFRTRYPLVELELRELVSGRQVGDLLQREIDVGIMRPLPEGTELMTKMLITEPLVLAVPLSNPLHKKKELSIDEISSERLITFSLKDSQYFSQLISGLFARAGCIPNIVQEATQLGTVLALVASGMGLAIVPESARHSPYQGIVYRRIKLPRRVDAELVLGWRADNGNPALAHFIEIAAEEARTYSEKFISLQTKKS